MNEALSHDKFPGIDEIPDSLLKFLPRIHKTDICNIVNAMIRLQDSFAVLKKSTVVCLPNRVKPFNQASSYRISLL